MVRAVLIGVVEGGKKFLEKMKNELLEVPFHLLRCMCATLF